MTLPSFNLADDGGVRQLPKERAFALELDETPTTGYRWHLEFSERLMLLSSELALADLHPPGAGGRRRWVFQPQGSGEFFIQAKLWREWLGDASVISRYRLTVRVA
ncbi:protease inhibitor I42 family protein [Chitinimonas arctica]|uniref:Protease inhibitor I42 family protein n=1 Tax=Chitinimonas arctica TaxID=2594795 RepID=A0A516SLP6_9NEIS|nr:protease inhibitor I42 family protein [Chitinimonas arctica]QDQ29072.1 protease inhibitor I42 family protein [Chitinimonas arctica]